VNFSCLRGRGSGKRLSWDRQGGLNRPPKGPHARRERRGEREKRREGEEGEKEKRRRERGRERERERRRERERERERGKGATEDGRRGKGGMAVGCGPLGVWVWRPHVPTEREEHVEEDIGDDADDNSGRR